MRCIKNVQICERRIKFTHGLQDKPLRKFRAACAAAVRRVAAPYESISIKLCRFRGPTPQSWLRRASSPAGEPMAVSILCVLCRVAAQYELRVNKILQISRADDIRAHCKLFHYSLCGRIISAPTYFERNETNPSVSASPSQLPCWGAYGGVDFVPMQGK